MPTIVNNAELNYAWTPISMLGVVSSVFSTDAETFEREEEVSFSHLSTSQESAYELFYALIGLPQNSSSIPSAIFSAHIEALQKLFQFQRPDEVCAYLYENYELAVALFGIQNGISKYFPGKLELDVLCEGEDTAMSQLVMRAVTHVSGHDGRKILKDFRREWWQKNYLPCFKDLTVSLKFQ